ncbi:MAG: sporulation integral membrane protein YtvI [Clostridia bacterium]|nr:sporulation integral membrane protein YtvI [Clostridia bacterium]MBR3954967.1 sporulation integral membrane protein YtvI [Clostridia bacterium]
MELFDRAKTDKRWNFIVNTAYFVIILGLAYFLFDRCLSLFLPLLVAFVVAMILKRPIAYIDKKTPLKRGLISVILVLSVLGIGVGLLVLLGFEVAPEIKGFFTYVYSRINDLPQLILAFKNWLLGVLANLPESFTADLSVTVADFLDNLAENGLAGLNVKTDSFNWTSVLSTGSDILINTVGQFPSLVISFVITIISSVFVCSDYEHIRDFILSQMSEENGRKLYHAKQLAVSSMFKMVKAYGIIFLITAFEMTIALSVLKLIGVYKSDYLFIIAILVALVDIIPVLGTGTVLIPWGVVSLLTGKIGLGIGLLITYAVVLVIRQVLEPKLVSGQIGLPPIVTITSMYVGTKVLGVFGFFIMPFLVTIVNEMNKAGIIHLFNPIKKKVAVDVPAVTEEQKDDSASAQT